jgi:hypothetical protein
MLGADDMLSACVTAHPYQIAHDTSSVAHLPQPIYRRAEIFTVIRKFPPRVHRPEFPDPKEAQDSQEPKPIRSTLKPDKM